MNVLWVLFPGLLLKSPVTMAGGSTPVRSEISTTLLTISLLPSLRARALTWSRCVFRWRKESSARLRQAFLLRTSWNDPLTLKLITLTGDSCRPLSMYSPGHARDFTPTRYQSGCTCSNHGCAGIQPMIHSGWRRETQGGQYRVFRGDAL